MKFVYKHKTLFLLINYKISREEMKKHDLYYENRIKEIGILGKYFERVTSYANNRST